MILTIIGGTTEVYPDLENFRSSVAMCDHPTHSAPQMRIGGNGKTTVQSDKGYRMAKATHGVWEGFWYLEMTIDEHQGNTRYISCL